MDPNVGTPHNKQSILRWDASTAAALIVLGSLAFLVWVNFAFSSSASISVKK